MRAERVCKSKCFIYFIYFFFMYNDQCLIKNDWILSVPCFLFLAPAHSQSIHASENPIQVGSNVTLSSQTEVTTGIWLSADMGIIVFIASGNAMIDMDWKDRVTFDSTTSSLTIKSLEVGDSGVYILEAFNSFRANLTLSVQGKDHFITSHVH